MTLPQRLAAIAAMGLDAALVLRFDADLAKVSAEDFVRRFLVETMQAKAILVGENFRFGHRQAGDVKLLAELGTQWGFDVEIVPPVLVNGAAVSSSRWQPTSAWRNAQPITLCPKANGESSSAAAAPCGCRASSAQREWPI